MDLKGRGPAIVLIEPQMGENIGMAARAMLNCGLVDLRLVNPRDKWPNPDALAASAKAKAIIKKAQVFDSTERAISDLEMIYATTARSRDMTIEVLTPKEAANRMRCDARSIISSGVLFGKESMGLSNNDLSLANAVLSVPLNPTFTSLNLAQAVFVVSYEWFQADDPTEAASLTIPKVTRPASKFELQGLFDHLEGELDTSGFFHVLEKKPIMVRSIRNMLQRARLTEQEIRTLRGVISSLVRSHKR